MSLNNTLNSVGAFCDNLSKYGMNAPLTGNNSFNNPLMAGNMNTSTFVNPTVTSSTGEANPFVLTKRNIQA